MTDSIEKPSSTETKGGLRGFFKRKKIDPSPELNTNSVEPVAKPANSEEPAIEPVVQAEPVAKPEELTQATAEAATTENSLESGLNKSRTSFLDKISNVFKGSFDLDDDLFDELEEVLITSDIGVEASIELVEKLRTRVKTQKIQDAAGVVQGLRDEIAELISIAEQPWTISEQNKKPYVMLMVGVNGVGKTTTTAKIAKRLKDQGLSVMLAAADTFRAACCVKLTHQHRMK